MKCATNVAAVTAVLAVIAGSLWLPRRILLPHVIPVLVGRDTTFPKAVDAFVVPTADDIDGGSIVDVRAALRNLQTGVAQTLIMTCFTAYDIPGCDIAKRVLESEGFQTRSIRSLPLSRMPDDAEVNEVISYLAHEQIRSAAILLPNYKTNRLGALYQNAAKSHGISLSIVSSPDTSIDLSSWWTSREAQKAVAYELLRWTHLL